MGISKQACILLTMCNDEADFKNNFELSIKTKYISGYLDLVGGEERGVAANGYRILFSKNVLKCIMVRFAQAYEYTKQHWI